MSRVLQALVPGPLSICSMDPNQGKLEPLVDGSSGGGSSLGSVPTTGMALPTGPASESESPGELSFKCAGGEAHRQRS